MKDSVMSSYDAPQVEILALNSDDVICTSLLAELFGTKLLKKSWNSWTGMETNTIWEGLN